MPCRLPGFRRRALRRRVRRPIYSHYDESTKWENCCYLQLIACVRQNVMNVLHDLKHMTLVHIYPYACTKWPEAYDIVTYILIHNDLIQQQQQHSLFSQASWGRLEMKPERNKFKVQAH